MTQSRILIVDDSSTTRLLLSRLLESDPETEVAAMAANGRIALAKLEHTPVDLVLLDVEMPELDGLETLRELRRKYPALPVVMFSRLTRRGTAESVEALFLGADDYVPKPDSSEALEQCVAQELLPRIHSLATPAGSSDQDSQVAPPQEHRDFPEKPVRLRGSSSVPRVELVTIASSTGGPAVLATVLSALAPDLTVPVLVVQHMPVGFTSAFAERLAQRTGLQVREAGADQPVAGAHVWLAAADQHLVVSKGETGLCLQLNRDEPEHSCRPAADVLFRSAAAVLGDSVLGVVLTGMGVDGLAGSRAIVEAGGRVLVQDRESSVVWGMPGSVARAGIADEMLSPIRLGRAIRRRLAGEG